MDYLNLRRAFDQLQRRRSHRLAMTPNFRLAYTYGTGVFLIEALVLLAMGLLGKSVEAMPSAGLFLLGGSSAFFLLVHSLRRQRLLAPVLERGPRGLLPLPRPVRKRLMRVLSLGTLLVLLALGLMAAGAVLACLAGDGTMVALILLGTLVLHRLFSLLGYKLGEDELVLVETLGLFFLLFSPLMAGWVPGEGDPRVGLLLGLGTWSLLCASPAILLRAYEYWKRHHRTARNRRQSSTGALQGWYRRSAFPGLLVALGLIFLVFQILRPELLGSINVKVLLSAVGCLGLFRFWVQAQGKINQRFPDLDLWELRPTLLPLLVFHGALILSLVFVPGW